MVEGMQWLKERCRKPVLGVWIRLRARSRDYNIMQRVTNWYHTACYATHSCNDRRKGDAFKVLPRFVLSPSNTLYTGIRLGLPALAINCTMRDFHQTACVRSESDENGASLKLTWHDQTLDGHVAVCLFPQQLIVHVVVIIDNFRK